MASIAIKYIRSLLLPKKLNQIDLLRRSMGRVRGQLEDLKYGFDHTKHCCLTCATGGFDLILIKKLERQAMWLRVLLRRRGTPKDLRDIDQLEFEFGKNILDRLEKSGGK